jgi:hypothetical protein
MATASGRRGTGGNRAELLFRKWLEAQGWLVHKAKKSVLHLPGKHPISTSHDVWGCIDVLGVHPLHGFWAAQVTTQSGKSYRRGKLRKADAFWPLHQTMAANLAAEYDLPLAPVLLTPVLERLLRVSIVVHEAVPQPDHRSRKWHYWVVEDRVDGSWVKRPPVQFDRKVIESRCLRKGFGDGGSE